MNNFWKFFFCVSASVSLARSNEFRFNTFSTQKNYLENGKLQQTDEDTGVGGGMENEQTHSHFYFHFHFDFQCVRFRLECVAARSSQPATREATINIFHFPVARFFVSLLPLLFLSRRLLRLLPYRIFMNINPGACRGNEVKVSRLRFA